MLRRNASRLHIPAGEFRCTMAKNYNNREGRVSDCQAAFDQIRAGGKARARGISTLYELYAKTFLRFFVYQRTPHHIAEELVQDSFVNVVRHCDEFRGDCPRNRLWRIARNTLIDRNRHQPELAMDNGRGTHRRRDPDFQVPPADGGGRLRGKAFAAFAEKHPDRAECLRLAVIEGWSTDEVAGFLDRTLGATREFISQCRKLMRPFLERCRDYLEA
jgi:RNA polymerase sigma-70 factor (ECF subfamily)